MNELPRLTATCLLAIAASGLFGANLYAENLIATPASMTTTASACELPKFGFDSQLIAGYGEQVTFVQRGSKAFRLGLEEQDVILALNGKRLTYRGAWHVALESAMNEGGAVTLKVRDARTGAIAIRQSNLLNY